MVLLSIRIIIKREKGFGYNNDVCDDNDDDNDGDDDNDDDNDCDDDDDDIYIPYQ